MASRHPEIVYDLNPDDNPENIICWTHDASQESVEYVLKQPVTRNGVAGDGRSKWTWLRLPNGDLILGTFPQGETYFACEVDASFPSNEKPREVKL